MAPLLKHMMLQRGHPLCAALKIQSVISVEREASDKAAKDSPSTKLHQAQKQ
jgi:hypothetical protein